MSAGDLLATAPGDVRWLSYTQDGAEWAAPYLRGHLVNKDHAGYWVADDLGSRQALTDEDIGLLVGTHPDEPPILPEVAGLGVTGKDDDDETPIFVDIAAVLAGKIERPKPTLFCRTDGVGLLYPGKVHGIGAEAGDGKTWLALAATAQELENGNAVVYLDWEDEVTLAVSRLLSLGTDGELMKEVLFYANPELLTASYRLRLMEAVDEQKPSLVIIDGVADSLAMNGIDERIESEYIPWTWNLTRPLARAGAAVLMLDHVTKSSEGRKGPRGTGAKIGAMHVSYGIKTIQSFSVSTPGRLILKVEKDRYGAIGPKGSEAAIINIEQDGDSISVNVGPPEREAGDTRPLHVMGQVEDILRGVPSPGLTGRAIESLLRANSSTVRRAVDELVAEGRVRRRVDGRKHLHMLIEDPFADGLRIA